MRRRVDFILELLKDIYPEGLQEKDYAVWEKARFEDRCNLFGMLNLLTNTCDRHTALACGTYGFHPIKQTDIASLVAWSEAVQEILEGV